MSDIKGIEVKIEVANLPLLTATTADSFYLGIYGLKGGREFRINQSPDLPTSGNEVVVLFGEYSCASTGNYAFQANHVSPPLLINDPLYLPIDLDAVQYVYLRKENGKPSGPDDDLHVKRATITLCDKDAKLRRFRLRDTVLAGDPIVFGDKYGLQHWLPEVRPPGCKIEVRLKEIEHSMGDRKDSAGNKWYFSFGANILGGPTAYNVFDTNNAMQMKPGKSFEFQDGKFPKEEFFVSGCCGQSVDIVIFGRAIEDDKYDDVGTKDAMHSVKCLPSNSSQDFQMEVYVYDGHSPHGMSTITYTYTVSTICVP